LSAEHEAAIARAIESGAYQSADEVIERALEVLRLEDESLRDSRDEIDQKVDRAFAQFERGEFYTAEESKADMEKRKAAWLANKPR
jgi:Arc/MetJ-type ribon-helix-helix transcriptional regulator